MRDALKRKWNEPALSAAPSLRLIIGGFGAAWIVATAVLILSG